MRLRARLVANPVLAIVLLLVFAGVAAAAVPAFRASERATFCVSCHEMGPYYDAWATGGHSNIECVECHVDAGALNHVSHKVVAAKELWIHLTGDPRFPQGVAEVPDSRCLGCHAAIPESTGPRFSHKAHASTGGCVTCHADAGHRVSLDALKAADSLKPGLEASAAAAAAGPTTASSGHPVVSCTNCHDPAATACSTCHAPPHKDRGACVDCHRPGPRWVFTHPASAACASCHTAPAKHFGASCASCHSPGVAFAKAVFRHTSSACASCHKAPAGHNGTVSCATCHKEPGVSWAATHPSSTACASCHKAPASHFGTACATCHKPLVAWRSATFKHPSVGGEHTYRSFACAKCHPSGYSSHTCVACHDSARGGD